MIHWAKCFADVLAVNQCYALAYIRVMLGIALPDVAAS